MQASSWPDIVALFREEAAGYSAKSAKQNAHRLSENEGIKARIAELRAQNAEKYQMSRAETLAWLTRVIRTGAGSITPEKELCQSYSVGKHGSRITMPDMGRISRFMTLL